MITFFKGNPKNIMCDANNAMSNRDPTGSPIFCADEGYAALSGLLVKTHGCEILNIIDWVISIFASDSE